MHYEKSILVKRNLVINESKTEEYEIIRQGNEKWKECKYTGHEALPRLQSASSWLVMEQLVSGVCRLSCAFHAAGNSPPYVRRSDTGQ